MLSLSQCLQATVSGRTSHSADLLHPGAGDAAMIFKIFTQQPVYFDRRQVHRVHLVSFSYKMRPVYNTLLETFFGLKLIPVICTVPRVIFLGFHSLWSPMLTEKYPNPLIWIRLPSPNFLGQNIYQSLYHCRPVRAAY